MMGRRGWERLRRRGGRVIGGFWGVDCGEGEGKVSGRSCYLCDGHLMQA